MEISPNGEWINGLLERLAVGAYLEAAASAADLSDLDAAISIDFHRFPHTVIDFYKFL